MGEELQLKLGQELGILSYNETPMKEIIRSGISVVSVDFVKLGQSISRFIANPRPTSEIYCPEPEDLRYKLCIMAQSNYNWSAKENEISIKLDISDVGLDSAFLYTGGMGIRINNTSRSNLI